MRLGEGGRGRTPRVSAPGEACPGEACQKGAGGILAKHVSYSRVPYTLVFFGDLPVPRGESHGPRAGREQKMAATSSQNLCAWASLVSSGSQPSGLAGPPLPHAIFKVPGREAKAVILERSRAEEPSGILLKMQTWGQHPWRYSFRPSEAGPRCCIFTTGSAP